MKKFIVILFIMFFAVQVQAADLHWGKVLDTSTYTISNYVVKARAIDEAGGEFRSLKLGNVDILADIGNAMRLVADQEYTFTVSAVSAENREGPESNSVPYKYVIKSTETNLPDQIINIPAQVKTINISIILLEDTGL